MRKLAVALSLVALSCGGEPETGDPFAAVQAIVTSVVAHHPDLVRLTIHAVPEGESYG